MRGFALLIVLLLAAACGTVATPTAPATPAPLAVTALPVTLPTAAPPVVVPVSQAAAAPAGDAEAGRALFNTVQPAAGMACSTCHRVDSEERLIGPGLLNIASRAAQRDPTVSAREYIHTSIVQPGAYVVDGYKDIMPKNWGTVFTPEQQDDLIAYLMSLHPMATAAVAGEG